MPTHIMNSAIKNVYKHSCKILASRFRNIHCYKTVYHIVIFYKLNNVSFNFFKSIVRI